MNILLSVVERKQASLNEFAQVGFFFNGKGESFSARGSEFIVDESEKVFAIDFFKFAAFSQFVFNEKRIGRSALQVDADDSAVDEFMFFAIEIVGLKYGGNFGNDLAFFEH